MPWRTDTSPPLPCLLCQAFAELQDGHLNNHCGISAQSLTQKTSLLPGLPYLVALVGTGYAHTGTEGQAEDRRYTQSSHFLLSVVLLKEMVPFYTFSSVPRSALPVQPTGELQKTPEPWFQEQGLDLGLSPEPAPQATLAGPFLSAPPTLERVTEHQAGTFSSTMPTSDNTIPTSFLLGLKSGQERRQEAVTTSIFPQSHQSAVSSWCPCSFFSCSVTKQSQLVYLQGFLH